MSMVLVRFLASFISMASLTTSAAIAQEIDERVWSTDYSAGRSFYRVHGSVVYGHEFGFFKSGEYCELDVIWLSISTYDQTVTEFKGQDIEIDIRVDDAAPIKVALPIVAIEPFGSMQILLMTNWAAHSPFIDALSSGSTVEIMVSESDPIFSRLDIPGDWYSLEGFRESRAAATAACRDSDTWENLGP
jgi:hypothetical protein